LADIYDRIKNQPLKITAEYWLTKMKPLREGTVPLPGTHTWLPDVGLCTTRTLSNGVIMSNCYPVVPSRCIVFAVDGKPQDNFYFDYSPYSTDGLSRDTRVGAMTLPSNAILVQQLMAGKYRARAYQPAAHIARRLEIPAIQLKDWAAGCFGAPTRCEVGDLPR
jgi:hypothetical protein